LKGDSDKQGKLVRSMDKKLRASEKEKSELRAKYDEVAAALIEKATEAEQFKRQVCARHQGLVCVWFVRGGGGLGWGGADGLRGCGC
jgi:chromosome segregation ATPase